MKQLPLIARPTLMPASLPASLLCWYFTLSWKLASKVFMMPKFPWVSFILSFPYFLVLQVLSPLFTIQQNFNSLPLTEPHSIFTSFWAYSCILYHPSHPAAFFLIAKSLFRSDLTSSFSSSTAEHSAHILAQLFNGVTVWTLKMGGPWLIHAVGGGDYCGRVGVDSDATCSFDLMYVVYPTIMAGLCPPFRIRRGCHNLPVRK